MIYEIDIENADRVPLVLPWSPDPDLFPVGTSESLPGYRHALIKLEVQSRGTGRTLASLAIQSLYGSEDKFGTLQTLAPGQKARIRVPGRWGSDAAEFASVLGDEGGSVQVIAVYNLVSERMLVKSANHIDVNVSRSNLR